MCARGGADIFLAVLVDGKVHGAEAAAADLLLEVVSRPVSWGMDGRWGLRTGLSACPVRRPPRLRMRCRHRGFL